MPERFPQLPHRCLVCAGERGDLRIRESGSLGLEHKLFGQSRMPSVDSLFSRDTMPSILRRNQRLIFVME